MSMPCPHVCIDNIQYIINKELIIKKKKNMKNDFNNYFGINDKMPKHVNIKLGSDIEVFIDPFLISNNRSNPIANKIYNRSRNFLKHLNENYVMTNDRRNGVVFLSDLAEANEYGLGYSKVNKGKGIGVLKAEIIYDSLRNNRFAKHGVSITNEADNVLLLVEGIGQDNMSDTLANVCRDIFADFTLNQCLLYGIPTYFTDIRYYDDSKRKWLSKKVKLPRYENSSIILVPTFISSSFRDYQSRYNWFLATNYWSRDIMNGTIKVPENTNLIYTKNDGSRKAIIKNINSIFKKPKSELINCVIDYPDSLINFKDYAKLNYLCVQYKKINEV